ncbi:ParB/RepB/Spo0J family partition protein [Leptolyngbya sp. NIES-2104]|uniref:ParB/RepB/Spo0J family partition protein n=1 Tax=Leptolyngbya sp. NIES-2104 TaxID=1552121 RepID=UPI0006EC4B1B|nr:ParB N-terminal domain-containing protein [Leptolyngbya sp. NIES-2104]GAP94850.1 chromosome (plasmid) partitioning protein ParB [Leptolyngbya sp. NIES-2104]
MSLIDIDKVSVGLNRRPLKDQKVADLMQSIQTNGLLNPITLDQNFTLIAGLHRLTACKLLGFTQIECKVVSCDRDHARLAEIDENLIRNELDALERSELWLERDSILDRMGLRARAGDNQFTQRGGETNSPPPKTTVELAQEIGYTERTFQQGKQIARDIVPEVKTLIRGTSAAKSPKALLQVARAGGEERKQAEQAERAAKQAEAKRLRAEAAKQARIAEEARAKQKELQIMALQSVEAEKVAKSTRKAATKESIVVKTAKRNLQWGDTWLLKRHLVYYGETTSEGFRDCLPSNAALAIVPPQVDWNHDFLADEARVVAVLRTQGGIHQFCRIHQLPFQFELLIGDLYLGLFSHHSLLKPEQPLGIEGIEAIVSYLVSLYTKPGHFVLNPGLGNGEVLMTCERMDRVCFAGETAPELVNRALDRWQTWTGAAPEKTD